MCTMWMLARCQLSNNVIMLTCDNFNHKWILISMLPESSLGPASQPSKHNNYYAEAIQLIDIIHIIYEL